MYVLEKKKEKKMNKKTSQFIILLLLVLAALIVYKVYIQEAVIFNSGSDGGKNNINVNLNIDIKDALKITALGGSAAAMIKACPPQSRPAVTLGLGAMGVISIAANDYIKQMAAKKGEDSISVTTSVSKINKSTSSGESTGVSKSVLENLSEIFRIIKEKVLGAPIRCDDSSWNPVDILDQLLRGFSVEEKFFIAIILMLLVVLYVSIGILLSIITRLIFNKPFSNRYLEILRIRWSQSNNVVLIVLFLMQLYGISYSIYALSAYFIGPPLNSEGTSWNPVDKLNDLLIGFSEEEKFFIGVILLLLGALYTSIFIMLLVLTRLIFNKPFENKYMEKIRI